MVDIQSAAAEIRRGIKKEDRKKPQGKNIMSASATQDGHKQDHGFIWLRGPDLGNNLGWGPQCFGLQYSGSSTLVLEKSLTAEGNPIIYGDNGQRVLSCHGRRRNTVYSLLVTWSK